MLARKFGIETRYLNERYQWSRMPHSFPGWFFDIVLAEAMQYKDRPQQIGEVQEDGTVVFTDIKSCLTVG